MATSAALSTTGEAMPRQAFSSYSHDREEDRTSIGRLCAELRLRALRVFRDTEALLDGDGIAVEIDRRLRQADVYVPFLTPASLASDPVVELEFLPAASLRRASGRPAIVALARGLGDSHEELREQTWERLGYDFEARWTKVIPAGSGPITFADAADVARRALRAAFRPGDGPGDGRWRLQVASRGERPAGRSYSSTPPRFLAARSRAPASRSSGSDFMRALPTSSPSSVSMAAAARS